MEAHEHKPCPECSGCIHHISCPAAPTEAVEKPDSRGESRLHHDCLDDCWCWFMEKPGVRSIGGDHYESIYKHGATDTLKPTPQAATSTGAEKDCPRCKGTGKNPDDSVLGYPANPCYYCLGTGVRPDMSGMQPSAQLPKQVSDSEELDTLVRDACSAVPVVKSEYRRRLVAYTEAQMVQAREEAQFGLINRLDKSIFFSTVSPSGDYVKDCINAERDRLAQLQKGTSK